MWSIQSRCIHACFLDGYAYHSSEMSLGGFSLPRNTSTPAVRLQMCSVQGPSFFAVFVPHTTAAPILRRASLPPASQCRNMHWENLDKLLAIVDREFGEQGFYHAGPGGETLSLQDGVVRTNCMDCLDRTNVVQSLLARRSMLVSLT